MKKILTLSVLAAAFSINAYAEKDVDYYQNNLEEAAKKIEECKQQTSQPQDPECKIAAEAQVKAHVELSVANLDWKGVAQFFAKSNCARYRAIEKDIPSNDHSCRILTQIYLDNIEIGKKEIAALSQEELNAKQKEYCPSSWSPYTACKIWNDEMGARIMDDLEAQDISVLAQDRDKYLDPIGVSNAYAQVFDKKARALIETYKKDPQLLKRDYNQCVERLDALKKEKVPTYSYSKVTADYPCVQVQTTHYDLKLPFNHFEEKVE